MMEPAGSLVGGLFVLSCMMQDVDPLAQTAIGQPHALSYIARDGKGAMMGWQGLNGQREIEARFDAEGIIRLTGASFKDSGEQTWANVRKLSDSPDFEMEWLMYDHPSRDGKMSVAVWSKGRCERLANDKEAVH